MNGISIHAPAWGATGERLGRQPISAISIHAPAWGATDSARVRCSPDPISIHAPAWGATLGGVNARVADISFQFTPPRGERHA